MRLIDADAISKIMYRKAFEEDSDLQRWDSGCWIRYKMFEQALEEAPTIEAEPVRRGRWIWGYEGYYCSECFYHPYGATMECIDGTYKYCPKCGALMEIEE